MKFFKITSKKRRRQAYSTLGGLVFGVAFSLVVFFLRPFSTIQETLSDLLYLADPSPTNVMIAAIDEKSLNAVDKRLPEWPRGLHAQAIDQLTKAGARVIVFDVLFAEASPEDAELERAMRDSGRVIMPVAGVLLEGEASQAGTFVIPPVEAGEYNFSAFEFPKPGFVDAALGLGHANLPPGTGDKVRHVPVTVSDVEGERFPALAVAAVMAQFNVNPAEPITVQSGVAAIPPGRQSRDVPVNDVRQMRINYRGGAGATPMLSYIDVIDGSFDQAEVQGKIVFVGAVAAGLGDTKAVPLGANEMAGVEVHANAVDTILRQRFLRDPEPLVTLLSLLAFTVLISLTVPAMRLLWGTLITVLVAVAYVAVALVMFQNGTILEIFYPVFLAFLMYLAMMLYRNISERAERSQVTGLFGTYVGKGPVAEAVLARSDSGELGLGGERAMLSLIFTDIRGFSTFSEQMTPHDLVNFLNEYLTAMTDIVFNEEGVLDKYIGDAVMAFWGWPKALDDHAVRAMRTSINMIKTLDEMQADWIARGLPKLGIRTGVHSGEASVGNMGSRDRFSITAMGDTVNLAARLEPINNLYGTDQMISAETLRMANEVLAKNGQTGFVTRYIDLVAVKGRKTGSPIHQLLGFDDGSVDTSFLPTWQEAIKLYGERKFREAGPAFQKVLDLKAGDGPAKLYVDRCQYFLDSPPADDWDGVFVMKTK